MKNRFPQKANIIAIKQETLLAKTFTLQFQNGKPDYIAGQYLTINNLPENPAFSRNYSISSSSNEEFVTITVKRQENGYLSRQLVDYAKVDDHINIVGIFGKFILPQISNENEFLFFAAGSGISPIFALIKELIFLEKYKNIKLYYSNRSPQDTIFYEELENLQKDKSNRFEIHYFFSETNQIEKARISAFMIPEILKEKNKTNTFAYLCGPLDYMDTIKLSLQTYGLNKNQIFTEEFNYLSEDENVMIPPPDKTPRKVIVHLNKMQKEFVVEYPDTILKAALKNDVQLPYSCSSGQCGSCTSQIVSGKVWLMINEVLTDKEIEKGMTLTCMGYPIEGNVELSYQ